MSVTWNWNRVLASVTHKNGAKTKLYTGGNCPFVELFEYKEDGDDMYRLISFAGDYKHFERCVNDGVFDFWKKVKFNTFFLLKFTPKIQQMAYLLTKRGIKVELYYKEIKEKKEKQNESNSSKRL